MPDEPQQKWRKVIVSTMKDEGPFIVEWIAHHLAIGFDGFVIFSNDCSDATDLILQRLDAMGVIEHYPNPLKERQDPQRRAYSRANQMDTVRQADWVLIVDADEFLNVHVGDRTVDDLIAACQGADAISINWRFFGSSDSRQYSRGLVTEQFTHGSSFEEPENGLIWGFKTLFKPACFDYFGVHRPRFERKHPAKPGQVNWQNGSGADVGDKYLTGGWRSNRENLGYEYAQVNHYAIKSRESFLVKLARGTANSKDKARIDLEYWNKFDINGIEDKTIQSPALRDRIDMLLQDQILREVVDISIKIQMQIIEELRTVPEYAEFLRGADQKAAE